LEVNAKSRVYAEELVEKGWDLRYNDFDYDGALKTFRRAIKFDPYSSDAYRGIGCCLLEFKQYKEAVDSYSEAIDLNPDNYCAYIERGKIYAGLQWDFYKIPHLKVYEDKYLEANVKDISKAIEDFTSAIEIDPTNDDAYYQLGECYQELKRYEEAIADFDEVIEFEPEWSTAYSCRGRCYKEWGKIDKANADLARAERLEAMEKLRENSSW